MASQKIPSTVKDHWNNVGELRCVITGSPRPTIHHVHGGSMADAGYHSGMAKRGVSDALVIPLKAEYHTGVYGIDGSISVTDWERYFGTQMEFIQEVSELVGYNLISLHEAWLRQVPPRG